MTQETGAQALWKDLANKGVDTCFVNPGTTELDLVRGLEGQEDIRCIVGLQENVCTGGADGYGRMQGKPAATLLHLGPGIANGLANLHNARRARTPIVNIIGDHASWHLPFDAPLTSDIESLARPVSGWVHRVGGANELVATAAESLKQAMGHGGQVVTVIFPADFQAASVMRGQQIALPTKPLSPEQTAFDLEGALVRLRQAKKIVFLLGGGAESSGLGVRAQRAVARLCAHLGATAYAETFPSRSERGQGLPAFDRLPYFPEPARAVLDPSDLVVLAGAMPPVTYFGYEGHPSELVKLERLLVVAPPGRPVADRLEQIAASLGAPEYQMTVHEPVAMPQGLLTPAKIGAVLSRELPDGAIVSVEGGTCGYPFYAVSATARRHTTLTNTGGAIGQGLPVALGAAIACPDRPVVGLLSDGSTQYTIQTLWTIAHEQLNIVVLIAANHQYAILRNELRRNGSVVGARAEAMTALDKPRIDWVGLAQAYGVPAFRAVTAAQLSRQLKEAFQSKGPTLVEMAL
jgi:acetolactate synthase-1/2/3 large subunit